MDFKSHCGGIRPKPRKLDSPFKIIDIGWRNPHNLMLRSDFLIHTAIKTVFDVVIQNKIQLIRGEPIMLSQQGVDFIDDVF
jgi:hypothetical protein